MNLIVALRNFLRRKKIVIGAFSKVRYAGVIGHTHTYERIRQ